MRRPRFRLAITWYFALIVTLEILSTVLIACGISYLFNVELGLSVDGAPFLWLLVFSLVIGSVMSYVINLILLKPIRRLSRAMTQVADGDFNVQLIGRSRINEIRDTYASFNLMTRELRTTEILQTDFMSNVSHEIKTPINAIEGYTMLLQDPGCTEEEREQYIEKIMFNTGRLSELVSNILLLSKIDNQAIETQNVNFRLDEQIRQSIMLLEPKWVEKDVEFDVDMANVTYLGNDKLLLHVWNNLISNAIKFNPRGGVIRIRLQTRGERVIFVIEDNGPGIGEEEIKHIFDKFYQGDNSRRQEGNGLGLALVKRILDLSGGDIAVENLPVRGCRMTVVLPL